MGAQHYVEGEFGLDYLGLKNLNNVYWNLTTPILYEQIIRRREGLLSHLGPVVVRTGSFTGRSPNDKFIVKEPTTEKEIWWGEINRPFSEEKFHQIWLRIQAYLCARWLRRYGPEISSSHSCHYGICLAFFICAQYVHSYFG